LSKEKGSVSAVLLDPKISEIIITEVKMAVRSTPGLLLRIFRFQLFFVLHIERLTYSRLVTCIFSS